MKRIIVLTLAITALAAVGCKEKSTTTPVTGLRSGADNVVAGGELQPIAAHGGAVGGAPAANPHGGMPPREMAAEQDHKGKVVSTMDTAGYTYIEVAEKGKKIWVAVTQVKVKVGDEVEFPDSPPMENFRSKTLNRTFDRIIFAPAIRINGKPGELAAHPKTS